jgi:hypothetical protein
LWLFHGNARAMRQDKRLRTLTAPAQGFVWTSKTVPKVMPVAGRERSLNPRKKRI